MLHTCSTLVINCIDFRFQTALRDFLNDLGLEGKYDLFCLAGSALNITRPQKDSEQEFVFKHIEISQRLHQMWKLILINHQNCGAYGDEDSKEQHLVDLKKAREIIKDKFPDLKVILYFANLEEKGKERKIEFEEVK